MTPKPPRTITVPAFAKINLYLHVTGKRADGYHELDSLIVFAGTGDTITIEPADALTFAVTGPRAAEIPAGGDNLVMKAARALATHTNVDRGARIVLEKHLPAASGIGGGSADAAAALLGLNTVWDTALSPDDLRTIGLTLGADVPICVHGEATFVGGIGEIFTPAPDLPACWFVLVNPGAPVETARVFSQRTGPFSPAAPFTAAPKDAADFATLLQARRNDLAEPAQHIAPAITEVLNTLQNTEGALLARMSGSGATCFALFAEENPAQAMARILRREHPGWWAEAAPLLTNTAVSQG